MALTKEKLLEVAYPIGTVYISTANVSPENFLGGTWAPNPSANTPNEITASLSVYIWVRTA